MFLLFKLYDIQICLSLAYKSFINKNNCKIPLASILMVYCPGTCKQRMQSQALLACESLCLNIIFFVCLKKKKQRKKTVKKKHKKKQCNIFDTNIYALMTGNNICVEKKGKYYLIISKNCCYLWLC